ncbi:hypothetical protein HDE69_005173 [Pedobacter cryoconitis]|uniref:Tail specific protease domain-containing protein n=1 Tax=Pedobacter cryoconitis TaxID=188932 RepID=A0A7W8YYD8_9SPHI|nr:S41 family peptidase [Pedobacter cryoconitis]MBB5624076.1 hypothetical protein [Pedobacter cryoconitis]
MVEKDNLMKKIFILILVLIPFFSEAQTCNCSENFKFLVERIKNNYVGYKDKIKTSNQRQFDFFTDSLQNLAMRSNTIDCRDIYLKWLAFFEDGHMGISTFTAGNASSNEIRTFFLESEKKPLNELSFDKYLLKNKANLDGIEGYWNYANAYKIGIVKDSSKKDEFIGFIIKADSIYWMPQQVKFRIKKENGNYSVVYFGAIDHVKYTPSIIVNKDIIDFGNFGKWYKGKNIKNTPKAIAALIPDMSPTFRILDNETNLLVIPHFAIRYKNSVDSILAKNKTLLENSKHLIIDIRNNSGGLTGTFENIIPYIYTKPIYTYGDAILATADNIKDGYENDEPDLPESSKKEIMEVVKKLKKHVGELYHIYPADTLKFDYVLKNPQRISILMNRKTASASELFILKAEQSEKVTLFGENSAGAVDYVENVFVKMPCKYYSVFYPALRSDRVDSRPLNNIGIVPNVVIPGNVKDWVEFVRVYKTRN